MILMLFSDEHEWNPAGVRFRFLASCRNMEYQLRTGCSPETVLPEIIDSLVHRIAAIIITAWMLANAEGAAVNRWPVRP